MHPHHYALDDIPRLPDQPGVYCFYNAQKSVIYVGKAKNLKKRVSSYFVQTHQHNLKTRKMVSEIQTFRFTIVNSEYEALLLENNLIKANQPPYNILLKDGKSYPYICITHEPFPRVIPTRQVADKAGQYYGPFTDTKAMYQMLDLIRNLYTIRTCTYHLSAENIQKSRFKVCLEYHLGHCQGPCEGLQSAAAYNKDIAQIAHLLKGNLGEAKKHFREKMCAAAQALNYTVAQAYKEKLTALEAYQAKSIVINPQFGDMDVFGMMADTQSACLGYLQVRNGAITFSQTAEIKKKLDEQEADILPLIIMHFRAEYASTAAEVLTNVPVFVNLPGVTLTVPKIGDKRKLVELAIKNALFLKKEQFVKRQRFEAHANKTLVLLQQDLQLKSLPLHIECFDNSNIQGAHPVAAMVVFKNGKPAKYLYRHFHIKTVVGPDDFASMREVVYRRYQRMLEEKQQLPDLIVIDGGKGQLNAAVKSLQTVGIYGQIPIIGIAKRLEEIYYPEDTYAIHISKKSASLKLLQQIRNEAHRFAITFHRDKRSKASLQSQLEAIPGVGPRSMEKLLQQFKSVKNIKEALVEDLAAHVGAKRAAQIKAHLNPEVDS
ncbi:MAG: excinuclease ABC subunit UvrC [Bacteroidota bacterium]